MEKELLDGTYKRDMTAKIDKFQLITNNGCEISAATTFYVFIDKRISENLKFLLFKLQKNTLIMYKLT